MNGKNHIWRNAGAWEHLIWYPEHKGEIKRQDIQDALQHCAVVNIKKAGGTPESNHKELQEIIEGNGRGAIRRQILALKHQVIITGGTFRYWEQLIEISNPLSGEKHLTGSGMDLYEYQKGLQHCMILRVRHPASTHATEKAYFNRLKALYLVFFPRMQSIWY